MEPELSGSKPATSALRLPARQGGAELLARALGLRAAEDYYRTLPTSQGLAACADRVLSDQGIDLATVHAAARCLPERGALLVTANHPTGILDGILLLSALLSRRPDVRMVANEALCCIPVLADQVIPIEKTARTDGRESHALWAVRRSWKRMECVIAFPAGTVAHWQWRTMRLGEAPWTDGIQRLAAKLGLPEYRATLSLKNPGWFHGCSAVSRKARTALLLRAFFAGAGKHPAHPVVFDRLER